MILKRVQAQHESAQAQSHQQHHNHHHHHHNVASSTSSISTSTSTSTFSSSYTDQYVQATQSVIIINSGDGVQPISGPSSSLHTSSSSSSSSSSSLPSSAERPDGDMDLSDYDTSSFNVPPCINCLHGICKPEVVFFGDNVKPAIHAQADDWVQQADALLIVGTSLTTWSAFRLVRKLFEKIAKQHDMSPLQVSEAFYSYEKAKDQKRKDVESSGLVWSEDMMK